MAQQAYSKLFLNTLNKICNTFSKQISAVINQHDHFQFYESALIYANEGVGTVINSESFWILWSYIFYANHLTHYANLVLYSQYVLQLFIYLMYLKAVFLI